MGILGTIAVVLLVLWALGLFAFHVSSGLLHVLLFIALVLVIVRLIQGRPVV